MLICTYLELHSVLLLIDINKTLGQYTIQLFDKYIIKCCTYYIILSWNIFWYLTNIWHGIRYSRCLALDAYRFVLSVAPTEIKGDERGALASTGCCHKFHGAQELCWYPRSSEYRFVWTVKSTRAEVKGTDHSDRAAQRRALAQWIEGHLEPRRPAHVHHTLGLAPARPAPAWRHARPLTAAASRDALHAIQC